MNPLLILKKEELFLKVHEQIKKAQAVILQSRKAVEQAVKQADRIKNEYDAYLSKKH